MMLFTFFADHRNDFALVSILLEIICYFGMKQLSQFFSNKIPITNSRK